jgi:hypothetical protein
MALIGAELMSGVLIENAEVLCIDNYFTGRRTFRGANDLELIRPDL